MGVLVRGWKLVPMEELVTDPSPLLESKEGMGNRVWGGFKGTPCAGGGGVESF